MSGTTLQLNTSGCSAGEVLKRNSVNSAWECVADNNTTYTAGSGLALSGTSFSIPSSGVTSTHLASNSVTAAKIAADAVGASEIAADAVGASEIAANAVGTSEIATNGVGSAEIAAGAVATSELADGAVTKAKIASGDKVAMRQVSAGCASAGSITTVSSCKTTACGSCLFFGSSYAKCNGSCPAYPECYPTYTSAQTCTNSVIGYLIEP